jgi:hypothetical protein
VKHYLMNPTWKCQLPCSYCWVRRHINRLPLTHAVERPLADWIAAIRRDPPETMDIGGGEPLTLPWTLDLIASFPGIKWGLSTNGLNTDRIQELADRHLRQIVNINLSYHPEAARMYDWYDALWKRHVLLLAAAGYPVGPNLEITPYNMEHGQWAIDWLRAQGLHMVVSPLCGGRDELKAPSPGPALVCDAGKNFITIAPDGQAWPCLSALNSYAWAETSIGNWLDDTIDLSHKPNPCRLFCVEFNVQYALHESGDFWGINARPAGGESCVA